MATIIELLGSPDAGKTVALQTISNRLTQKGIANEFIIETRGIFFLKVNVALFLTMKR